MVTINKEIKFTEFQLKNERNEKAYFLFSLNPGSKVFFEHKNICSKKSNTEKYIIYSSC
jgi:hypothetical protein